MSTWIRGPRTWSMTRDSDGHRDYSYKVRVGCDPGDGPGNALLTPGLPIPGSYWIVDNEIDLWAWCRQDAQVHPVVEEGDPNTYFDITFSFSTKAYKRCQDQQWDDPLLVPPVISGNFSKYTEEATHDVFGQPILNSAFESFKGPHVEFDNNRPTVKMEMNVPILDLQLLGSMRDTVNAFPLWGLPPRTIKLSNVSWERKFHGQCYVYYKLDLEFEIRYETFDRDLPDEGTKVLHGHWNTQNGHWTIDLIGGQQPDPYNPAHFIQFKDIKSGENTTLFLNGAGLPAGVCIDGIPQLPPDIYLSIQSPNRGQSLFFGEWWVKVTNYDNLEGYNTTSQYTRGELVLYPDNISTGHWWVAIQDNVGRIPDVDLPGSPSPWLDIGPTLGTPSTIYDPETVYVVGDFVTSGCTQTTTTTSTTSTTTTTLAGTTTTSTTSTSSTSTTTTTTCPCVATTIGKIHVAYYRGSDFTLLGIPTEF